MADQPNTTTTDLAEWARSIMGGYTEAQLQVAFDAVRPDGNWKLPISIVVNASVKMITRDQIARAIDFYAGGGATFTDLPCGGYRVEAPGYYALIGA